MARLPDGMDELDFRTSDGIEITLLWHKPTDTVWIAVLDRKTGDRFARSVAAASARDAFRHPYAYDARERELATASPASLRSVTGP